MDALSGACGVQVVKDEGQDIREDRKKVMPSIKQFICFGHTTDTIK